MVLTAQLLAEYTLNMRKELSWTLFYHFNVQGELDVKDWWGERMQLVHRNRVSAGRKKRQLWMRFSIDDADIPDRDARHSGRHPMPDYVMSVFNDAS